MYCDFYHLTERPFNVTPDPRFLYLNARYREAIASLNYGITQRKGFITLIGEAGTGKTTLLNKLLEDLDQKTKSVFIFNTHVTFEEILEYIFAEFDLPVHNGKKLYMLQRLNNFLLEELRGGGNVALLIDEAQDLEFSVLEDLRLLSNLETAKEKILQIVLSGQPELGQKLSNPVLRQLRQRIGINCRLLPLSRDEITEYVQFRLQSAGCPDLKLFSRDAEEQIYHFSRGIPRLVNVVCDNALVIGYALGKKRIGADVITEAAADLLAMEPPSEVPVERPVIPLVPERIMKVPPWWGARLGVMAIVVVLVFLAVLSMGQMLRRHTAEPRKVARVEAPVEVVRPGSQPRGTGVDVQPHANDRLAGQASERLVVTNPVRAADQDDVAVAAAKGPAPAKPERVAPQPEKAAAPDVRKAPENGRVASAPAPSAPMAKPAPAFGTKAADPPGAKPVAPVANGALIDAPPSRPAQMAALQPGEAEVAHAPIRPKAAAAPEPAPDGHPARLEGMQFSTVTVRSGDSLSSIALSKYGQASFTVLDLLKMANPELKEIDVISRGQSVRLPELGNGFPILNEGVGHYSILVYTTPQAWRATALESALRHRGFKARVTPASIGSQRQSMSRVVVGFAAREDGSAVGRKLQQLFREDARVAELTSAAAPSTMVE